MKLFILLFTFFTLPLWALHIDSSASSYNLPGEKRERVDLFDFSGEYPLLENIDINARRKKSVEMVLSGEYPLLEKVNYEGSFGNLIGKFTGSFPKLTLVNFLTSSAAIDLDLTGKWKQSCTIHITGSTEDVRLLLPKDVGLFVRTKIKVGGKVVNNHQLIQKGMSWLNKTFVNEKYKNKEAEVVLTLDIEITKGRIVLN